MPSFDYQPTTVKLNPLLDYADLEGKMTGLNLGRTKLAGEQQDLTDRGTLRDLAAGLTTRDASAIGTAASLGALGQSAVTTLSTADSQTAASKLAALTYNNGLFTFGGAAPAGGSAAPAGGGGSAPAADGSFEQRMGMSEGGKNSGIVNSSGYSGQFQFGTGRLTDLGMYQPAQGENPNGNKWQGTFNIAGFPDVKTHADFLKSVAAQRAAFGVHVGNIDQAIAETPGADKFNRDGLRAVAHLGGVGGMQKFVSTGGQHNPADSNGTSLSNYYQKFAQGGAPALQASFGHPDGPHAPAGRVQVASAAGTAGMPQTMTDAAPATMPVPQAASLPVPPIPPAGGPPPVPSTDDVTPVDTLDGAQGLRAGARFSVAGGPIQTKAAGALSMQPPAAAPAAPMQADERFPPDSGAAPAPPARMTPDMAVQQAQRELAPQQAGMAPDAANQQVVQRAQQLMGGTPPAAAPQAPAAASPAAPPAPPVASAPPAVAPQDRVEFARNGMGQYNTHGLPADFAMARVTRPDGSVSIEPRPIPGTQKLEIKDSGPLRSFIDPRNGQTVRTEAIPDHSRPVFRDVQGGTQQYQSGQPVGPIIPYSGRPEQTSAYHTDVGRTGDITASVQSAQANAPRLNEMADLAGQLKTGPTADVRAKAAQYLEQFGVSPDAIKRFTGMSSGSASQEFIKLSVQAAGADAKSNVGSNNGIQSIQLYQSANPGLQLLPDANKRVTNMMRVANQATQDYGQGALSHFGDQEDGFLHRGASYTPLTAYNREWQAQNNPQVYAAATGILNGDPFERWSHRVTPAEATRAAGIAVRIDPNAMVPGRNGHLVPARSIAQAGR